MKAHVFEAKWQLVFQHGIWVIIKSKNHLHLAYFGLGITYLVFLYILSQSWMSLPYKGGNWSWKWLIELPKLSTSGLTSIQIQVLWTPSQVGFFVFIFNCITITLQRSLTQLKNGCKAIIKPGENSLHCTETRDFLIYPSASRTWQVRAFSSLQYWMLC